MPGSDTGGSYERIYSVVSRIPRGRVATYGQVARLAGLPGQARLVGYALSAIDGGSRIPWHRVVNAQGQTSARRDGSPASIVFTSRYAPSRGPVWGWRVGSTPVKSSVTRSTPARCDSTSASGSV